MVPLIWWGVLGSKIDEMFLRDIGDELVSDVVACLSKLYINDFSDLYLYNYNYI